MIFILSPSKTMSKPGEDKPIALRPQSRFLLEQLRNLNDEEAARLFKLKPERLQAVMAQYRHFENQGAKPAVQLYEGSVFKGLALSNYTPSQWQYLNDHVVILSAFYGPLRALEPIAPYRLDLKMAIFSKLPRDFWQPSVAEALAGAGPVVNLASDEFSQLVKQPMIHIVFKEGLGQAQLVIKSTYAKVARGCMLNYAALKGLETPEALKDFNELGYAYQPNLDSIGPDGSLYWTFARP